MADNDDSDEMRAQNIAEQHFEQRDNGPMERAVEVVGSGTGGRAGYLDLELNSDRGIYKRTTQELLEENVVIAGMQRRDEYDGDVRVWFDTLDVSTTLEVTDDGVESAEQTLEQTHEHV